MYLMMMLLNDIISCLTHSIHHWHYFASCSYLFHFSLCCVHTALSQFYLWVVNLTKSLTDLSVSSSSMTSSLSQDLLCLSDHCVSTAYQLKQFELMNHVYILFILNDVVSLVHNIIILYSIFTDYQSSVNTSNSWQICADIDQSINLDYFISWSLTKSSLIKIICCFHQKAILLLSYLIFSMWILFQMSSNKNVNSFKTEQRLHQFLSFSSNQSDESESTVSSSFKLTFFKTHSRTSISTNKSISCSSSLSQNMINIKNNSSCYSNIFITNFIFFKAQMQIL